MNQEIQLLQGKIVLELIKDETELSSKANCLYYSLQQYQQKYNYESDKISLLSDLGSIIKFCRETLSILLTYPDQTLVFYSQYNDSNVLNSLFLLGSFFIIVLKQDTSSYISLLKPIQFELLSNYIHKEGVRCHNQQLQIIQESLLGLEKVDKLNWIDLETFNIQLYATQLIHLNLSEVVPQKLFAFSSPLDDTFITKRLEQSDFLSKNSKPFQSYLKPQDYVEKFKQLGVTQVVRLNSKTYKSYNFTNYGIKHHDIYFARHSVPTLDQIKEFIKICKGSEKVAIHCGTGYGRACVMIACYCMNQYKFSASSIINWIRIIRPGSICEKQAQYIIEQEECIQNIRIL